MRYLIFTLIFLTGCVSQPVKEIPVAKMVDDVYETEVDAVIAAARAYNERSIKENREYIGGVYKIGDGYRYSVAVGRRGLNHVTVKLEIKENLISIWHTHSKFVAVTDKYFSSSDIEISKYLNTPIYLINYSGEIRKAYSNTPLIEKYNREGRWYRYAKGEVIYSQ